MEKITRLCTKNGLVIFSKSSCCICYAVNVLFQELGVSPFIHEIDHDPEGKEIEKALSKMGSSAAIPAVFIGGKFIGSTNEVMTLHLSGSLMNLLRPYVSSIN